MPEHCQAKEAEISQVFSTGGTFFLGLYICSPIGQYKYKVMSAPSNQTPEGSQVWILQHCKGHHTVIIRRIRTFVFQLQMEDLGDSVKLKTLSMAGSCLHSSTVSKVRAGPYRMSHYAEQALDDMLSWNLFRDELTGLSKLKWVQGESAVHGAKVLVPGAPPRPRAPQPTRRVRPRLA